MPGWFKAYRFLNTLSIDVALGAGICSWFFGVQLHHPASPMAYLVLVVVVWGIYTADHLLDARRTLKRASSYRHQFHQKYFKPLGIALTLLAVITSIVLFYLPGVLVRNGVLLSLFVLVYLILQQHLLYFKEFVAALFYTIGVLLPLLPLEGIVIVNEWLLIIQFLMTAWINLLLFSYFDRQNDVTDNHISFVTDRGEKAFHRLVVLLFLICMVITAYQVYSNYLAALILFLMDMVLFSLLIWKRYFAVSDRFRLIGDLVFIFPVFVWLIQLAQDT